MSPEQAGGGEGAAPGRSRTSSPRGAGRQRARARKRKRKLSETSSDDGEYLPENSIEVEKTLQATAAKNNLTDESVKKILKKVVTNDHVLALVRLREEEEEQSAMHEVTEDEGVQTTKITRSKAKELTKLSPTQSAPWQLELTPIKHIPVKTRPEVEALMASELPDESDEEYQLTNDDVMSDDEHTVETCSDLDSQPRTPATPGTYSSTPASPQPEKDSRKDGPFKVPGEIVPSKKKRTDSEDEPTIARRTRSKLCLSATAIETIEESFVPPDDPPIPQQEVDDLWNNFLNECLNPAQGFRIEDDDEADPEYNVAADQEAYDDDEDNLERSLANISRKEIDDLYNELMFISNTPYVPDASVTAGKDLNTPIKIICEEAAKIHLQTQVFEARAELQHPDITKHDHSNRLGTDNMVDMPHLPIPIKEEPTEEHSQETAGESQETADKPQETAEEPQETAGELHESVGEPQDAVVEPQDAVGEPREPVEEPPEPVEELQEQPPAILKDTMAKFGGNLEVINIKVAAGQHQIVQEVEVDSTETTVSCPQKPQIIRNFAQELKPDVVTVVLPSEDVQVINPEQVQILQQQIRQHVQLATSNYLQIYAHPKLWNYAPLYKDYLVTLNKIVSDSPRSVANVCNLQPALEICDTWEKSLSEKTPENEEMVKFMEKEVEKCMRRNISNIMHVGRFHSTYMAVIANSNVILYPHLLPPVPYRCDKYRRQHYMLSEDRLIAFGLQQFWEYLEANKDIYKQHNKYGFALPQVTELLVKHMFPWMTERTLKYHISSVRRQGDEENPIREFFEKKIIRPVQHKLLPFNPNLTLYDQPEYEMPIVWIKHISKFNKRAKEYLVRRSRAGVMIDPPGVAVEIGKAVKIPLKIPNSNVRKKPLKIAKLPATDVFSIAMALPAKKEGLAKIAPAPRVIPMQNGGFLVPVMLKSNFVSNGTETPISIINTDPLSLEEHTVTKNISSEKHSVNENSIPAAQVNVSHINKNTISSNIYVDDVQMSPVVRRDHCKCCLLMKEIEKKKKLLITSYFKVDRNVRVNCCDRSDGETPKVTRRLRYLLRNFKMHMMVNLGDLHRNVEDMAKKTKNGVLLSEGYKSRMGCTTESDDAQNIADTLEDIKDQLTACAYMNKLNLGLPYNRFYRKKLSQMFFEFDTSRDEPTSLFKQVCRLIGDLLPELTVETLRFLTPQQADLVGSYRDYFLMEHLTKFTEMVKEEFPEATRQACMLTALKESLGPRLLSACDLCHKLMCVVRSKHRLARYLFDVTPHRSSTRKEVATFTNHNLGKESVEGPPLLQPTAVQAESENVLADDNISDEEQDLVDTGVDVLSEDEAGQDAGGPKTEQELVDTCTDVDNSSEVETQQDAAGPKTEQELVYLSKVVHIEVINEDGSNYEPAMPLLPSLDTSFDTAELTVSKTEIQPELTTSKTEIEDDYSCSSHDTTLTAMSEDLIKSERIEWTRDEDKVILEAIMRNATPVETEQKSVPEVLEEKNLFEVLSDGFVDKTVQDVRTRVNYLLSLVALTCK